MKKVLLSIALFVLLVSSSVFGQNFTCTVQNQVVVGTELTFDLYILRTGGTDLGLANVDLVLDFNSGNFTSPTFVIVSMGTLKLDTYYGWASSIQGGSRATLNLSAPSPGSLAQYDQRVEVVSNSGNGTLIASVKLTGISNVSGTAGLQWNTSFTIVNHMLRSDPDYTITNVTSNGIYTNPDDLSLPVQMSSINASTNKREGVVVTWATHSETDCAGFNVLRSASENGKYQAVTTAMLPGQGNSSATHEYRFVDRNVENGKTYWYKIMEISTDGKQKMHGPISVEAVSPVPNEYALSNGYPNPFNPVVTMTYQLPETGSVQVNVFNSRGELMKVLAEGTQEAGYYTVTWNGKRNDGMQAPSGMYFIRMQAGSFNRVQKVMLLK